MFTDHGRCAMRVSMIAIVLIAGNGCVSRQRGASFPNHDHSILLPATAGIPERTGGNTPAHSSRSREHEGGHHDTLHFSHPLIGESPSPDTKVRLDYFFRDMDDAGQKSQQHTVRLEMEYAFHRSFSIEVDVPYVALDPEGQSSETNLGSIGIGLKFANFAFEEHNLLLGYGIEFGLPTGDDSKGIGSNNIFEIEPFLSIGYKWHDLEIVAFAEFGIPTNQGPGEEVETELGSTVSLLYPFMPRLRGLLELDGETVLSGDESGETKINITPGIKLRPFDERSFEIGLGASFPLSTHKEFDFQVLLSLFYHF